MIDHAIRFTVQQTRNSFVYPASHFASSLTASDLPRMGERFRLKANFTIPTNWSAEAKAIAQAMKTYGLLAGRSSMRSSARSARKYQAPALISTGSTRLMVGMKITVVGASGLIGTRVVDLLTAEGHDVVAASRGSGVDVLTGDGLAEALSGADALVGSLRDVDGPQTCRFRAPSLRTSRRVDRQ